MVDGVCLKGLVQRDGLCMSEWTRGLYDAVITKGFYEKEQAELREAFAIAATNGIDGNDKYLSDAEAGLVPALVAISKAMTFRYGSPPSNISNPTIYIDQTQTVTAFLRKKSVNSFDYSVPDHKTVLLLYNGVTMENVVDLYHDNKLDRKCTDRLDKFLGPLAIEDREETIRWAGRWLSTTFPQYWETTNPSEILEGSSWATTWLAELRKKTIERGKDDATKNSIIQIFDVAACINSEDAAYRLDEGETGLAVALLTMQMVRQGLNGEKTIPISVTDRVLTQLTQLENAFNNVPSDKKIRLSPALNEFELLVGYYDDDDTFTSRDYFQFDNRNNLEQMRDFEGVNLPRYISLMLYGKVGPDWENSRVFMALMILTVASRYNKNNSVSIPPGSKDPLDALTLLERTAAKLKRDYPGYWE